MASSTDRINTKPTANGLRDISQDEMEFSVLWASAHPTRGGGASTPLRQRLDKVSLGSGARARVLLGAATSVDGMSSAVSLARQWAPGDLSGDEWFEAVVDSVGGGKFTSEAAATAAAALDDVRLGEPRFSGKRREVRPDSAEAPDFTIREDALVADPIFQGVGDSAKAKRPLLSTTTNKGVRTPLPSPRTPLPDGLVRKNSNKPRGNAALLAKKASLGKKPGGLSAAARKLRDANLHKKAIVQTATTLVQDPNSHAAKEQEKRERESRKLEMQQQREKARVEEAAARQRKEEERRAMREAELDKRKAAREEMLREKERRREALAEAAKRSRLSDEDEESNSADDEPSGGKTSAAGEGDDDDSLTNDSKPAMRKRRLAIDDDDDDDNDSNGSGDGEANGGSKRQKASSSEPGEYVHDALGIPDNVRVVVGQEINTLQPADVAVLKIFFDGNRGSLFTAEQPEINLTLNVVSKPTEKEGFTRVIESLYIQLNKDGKWKKIRRRKNVRD